MKKCTTLMLSLALASSGAAMAQSVAPVKSPDVRTVKKSAPVGKRVAAGESVLAERSVAPGVTARLMRGADGFIYRTFVKDGVEKGGRTVVRKPFRAASNYTFYEGFESHTGQLDWIPEGWTEKNAEGNFCTQEMASHNINNTWSVQDTGDGYWTDITSDGMKEAWIHFAYKWEYTNGEGETVSGEAVPQDDWLITPEIEVKDGDGLYFLLEFDLGGVYAFDWDTMKYDHNQLENDMEVLVSTDDGANWKSLWKVSEDVCSDMTDAEMYDCMAELKYASYSVPLADYAGKKIKIAFRYTNIAKNGFSGNSAAVDAVTVGKPAAEANYSLPYGTLLAGLSSDLHVYTESYALFPAYAPQTWYAASNSYTSANAWNFYDVETGDFGDAVEEDDAKVVYPYSAGNAYPFPKLTATNASSSDTYQFGADDAEQGGMIFGGRVKDIQENEPVYVGNYDYQHKRLAIPSLGGTDYCFGTSAVDTWGDGVVQTAFGNLFYAPAAPFTIDNVVVTLGEYDADADAEFTLDIYTVDAYGTLSDQPVATSKLKGSEITGNGFYNAVFHLDEPYNLDSNVLVLVSGFAETDKVREFAGCTQSLDNDAEHNYAYMMFKFSNGSTRLYSASDALTDYSSALLISFDGNFHTLHAEKEVLDLDPYENVGEVAVASSSKPEKWFIVDDENIAVNAGGTDYDWLKVTPVAKEDGTYAVHFSAAPNVDDREKTVTLGNGGATTKVLVRQMGTSGIGGVSVKASGIRGGKGEITVSGLAGQSVVIVDAAGMTVVSDRSSSATATYTVAPGFYIVKAGDKVAKLIVK